MQDISKHHLAIYQTVAETERALIILRQLFLDSFDLKLEFHVDVSSSRFRLAYSKIGGKFSFMSFSMSGFVSRVKLCVDYVRNKHFLSKNKHATLPCL